MASAHVFEATDANFEQEVVNSPVPVVIDFWAPWCGPCRQIAPIVEELAGSYGGAVRVGKLNVDNNKKVASALAVASIPTLVAYKGGKVVGRMVGFPGRRGVVEFFEKAKA